MFKIKFNYELALVLGVQEGVVHSYIIDENFLSYCLVNQILSNGKYKSNVHRAVLYNNATRISMVTANGPSLDQLISPLPEFVNETHPPAYTSTTFRQYYELNQSNSLDKKSSLDRIRILTQITSQNQASIYHTQLLYNYIVILCIKMCVCKHTIQIQNNEVVCVFYLSTLIVSALLALKSLPLWIHTTFQLIGDKDLILRQKDCMLPLLKCN